jgi:hypothetical protein
MKKRFLLVGAGCALLVLCVVLGRGVYRDARYWQYDDYRWNCYAPEQDHCVRGSALDRIPHDLLTLVRAVNRSPDNADSLRAPDDQSPWDYAPKLKVVGIRGDTVDVEVVNAWTLTQSMGTSGAGQFIAEAVLTLTESPGIRYVNLIFEEGDHAAPGCYSRESLP